MAKGTTANINEDGEVHEYINANDEKLQPDFDLYGEKVNEKSYAKGGVKMDAKQAAQPIPEPVNVAPPLKPPTMPGSNASKEPPPPANPGLAQMSTEESKNAAKKAAEMILSGYSFANQIGNMALQISPKKLKALARKGDIDLSIPIPYAGGQISIDDMISEYNEQNGSMLSVSSEFKKEVSPVLERVLAKKGIGATDEQQLIYLFGKDLVMKGIMIKETLGQRKDLINQLKDLTLAYRNGTHNQYFATQPVAAPPPPPNPVVSNNNFNPPPTPPPTEYTTFTPPPPPPRPKQENFYTPEQGEPVIPLTDYRIREYDGMEENRMKPRDNGRDEIIDITPISDRNTTTSDKIESIIGDPKYDTQESSEHEISPEPEVDNTGSEQIGETEAQNSYEKKKPNSNSGSKQRRRNRLENIK